MSADQDMPDRGTAEALAHPVVHEFLRAGEHAGRASFVYSILDALPNAVFIKDSEHRWVLVNDAFCVMLGQERAALIGATDYDFFPASEARVFWEKDEEVMRTGVTSQNEEAFTGSDGETRWILTTKRRLAIDEARVIVGVIQDISHRKAYEESLERLSREAIAASQTKSLFLTKMSHELRTPLNAVIGYTELIAEEAGALEPERTREDCESILGAARHLLTMIDDILDLARVESGEERVRAARISLATIAREACEIARPIARQRSTSVECIAAGEPFWIWSDPSKVRQILLNLIGNAAKYTVEGRVTVRIDARPGALEVAVTDTGPGIEPERLAAIFEPFVQLGHGQERAPGGVGLGLAITRRLAELLGGVVRVESEVGVGSTFALSLPRGDASS